MTAYKKRCKTPQELISYIQKQCREGGPYIFRGTNRISKEVKSKYDKVSSSVYREEKYQEIFEKYFQPIDIEKEIVRSVGVQFPTYSTAVEILTDFQHFSSEATLIDFSHSLFVALFFACSGKPEKDEKIKRDGELIALRTKGLLERVDIYYPMEGEMETSLLRPARTQLSRSRVEFQSSIFVHAPKGYIEKSLYDTFVVPKELKREILDYLKEFHNIYDNTIYNDLFGFIQNRENFRTPRLFFFRGVAAQENKRHREAINHYNEAIFLKPDYANAYHNRGVAKSYQGLFREAINDYDKTISLKSDYAMAYCNRGITKLKLGQRTKAITDLSEAIRLDRNYVHSYVGRGEAQFELGHHEEAITDYNEAIRLDPDLEEAYYDRGNAKFGLGRYKDAISDYDQAINLKHDYTESYFHRGCAKRKIDELDEARKDFEQALNIARGQGNQYLLAKALWKLSGLPDR